MAVHTAIVDIVNVNNNGEIISKDDATISQVMASINGVRRVFQAEAGSAPNAGSSKKSGGKPPTIHQYLELEDTAGFNLVHMDQYYIITQDSGTLVTNV